MTLPNITNKQHEILTYLLTFRYLTRLQNQLLLHHKDYKRTTTWLNDLLKKKYINRIYNKQSYTDRSKPAIFYIATNGIKYIRQHNIGEKAYRERYYQGHKKSETFRELCIWIANVYIRLAQDYGSTFKFYTQANYPVNGVIKHLSPHCGFLLDGTSIICELFQKKIPAFYIESRIKKYSAYIESRSSNTTAYALFIVETDTLKRKVTRQIKKLHEQGVTFHSHIATYQEIMDNGVQKEQFQIPE